MEGKMKSVGRRLRPLVFAVSVGFFLPPPPGAQEQAVSGGPEEQPAHLRLRKTPLKTREHRGKTVEGEERIIKQGDSLWHILIREKGLSEKRFNRYLVIISSLNPRLKKPNILQVGQTIFIPVRPDEILGIDISSAEGGAGKTKVYRVRRGDYLYKILREQFGLQEKKEIRSAFEQVKELNPGKKDWNLLFIGEAILFSGTGKAPAIPALEPEKPVGLDYGRNLPAQENLQLLEQVMTALGNELHRGGEEVVPLREGTIRIDRDYYPIVRNPKIDQKVILDTAGKIPPSLRSKLEAPGSATPVVSMKKGDSLHDAVSSLLSGLGYRSLLPDRPVEIHDGGVGLQVKGEWMVATPERSGGKEEVIIINLTDESSRTPDYLRDYLSLKGMNLKEILLPSLALPALPSPIGGQPQPAENQIENWPRDRGALIDSLLKSYGIAFSSGQQLSVPLREGIRLDTTADRLFEFGGKKIALLFRSVGEEASKALQEREGIRMVELDLQSLSARDLIARLLDLLGEKTAYREHRFPANEGAARDKTVLGISGFLLANRSLLLTDRQVPKGVQRFFADKGLRVVYFQ
ncbi:MAG: LysM peptidoglycan-binding domain-containing protein [Deltaproteobacteria bacterium]|nr:LysM peptidoglycan-binding domain-containing protein [Deltaproteobacteria bacterium]